MGGGRVNYFLYRAAAFISLNLLEIFCYSPPMLCPLDGCGNSHFFIFCVSYVLLFYIKCSLYHKLSKAFKHNFKKDLKVLSKWLRHLFILFMLHYFSNFFLEWGIQLWSIRCLEVVLRWNTVEWKWNLNLFCTFNIRGRSFVYEVVYSVYWAMWVLPIFSDLADRSKGNREEEVI